MKLKKSLDAAKRRSQSTWYLTKRLLPLIFVIIITTFIFGDITQLVMTLWNLSQVAVVGIFWHFFRKRMWWYIDLRNLVLMACSDPLGSAIVFMSITLTFIACLKFAIR